MIKYKSLIAILLFSFSVNYILAQEPNKYQLPESFVDSLNKEFVIHSLKSSRQNNMLSDFKNITSNNYSYDLFLDFLDSKNEADLLGKSDYVTLITKVNNIKKTTPPNLDSLKKFYISNQTFKKKSPQDEIEFDLFYKKIDSIYKTRLIRLNVLNVKTRDPNLILLEEFSISNEFLYGICSGIGFLAVIWTIVAARNNKRRKKHTRKEIEFDMNDNNLLFDFKELEKRFKLLESQLKKVELERDFYKNKFEEAVKDLDEVHNIENDEIVKASRQGDESSSKNVKANVQYYPSPLSDGTFRKVDGNVLFSEGASIYCFRLTSDTEAEFDFCQEPSSISMALNNRNDLILSVAEEMEGNASNAKKILTYNGHSGRLILEDSKWVVVKKVKIKYI